jgi:HAMP domain-containing protein
MFRKIKYKLLFFFLILSIGPLAFSMYSFYLKSISSLKQRTYDHLKAVREIKRKEIEAYFHLIRNQAVYFAGGALTLNAFNDFNHAFSGLRNHVKSTERPGLLETYYNEEFFGNLRLLHPDTFSLQKLYPSDPRSVLLQTQYLISNKTVFKPNEYNNVHEKYHGLFSSFAKINGFYDVFLIEDSTGYILYSVKKEIDFATSLLSDAHAESNLGRLFRKVRYSGLKYQAVMSDFESYLPSSLAPAAFLAAPIYENSKKVGTLVFQVPIEKVNTITTSNQEWGAEGLGKTGESYIVGADCKMRTDSRFVIESPQTFFEQTGRTDISKHDLDLISFYKTTVLFLTVCNESVTQALGGQSGTIPVVDYRGVKVLSSHAKLEIPDVNWIFLAEIDEAEALMPVQAFARNFALIVALVIAVVFFVALFVAHTIAKPIRLLAKATGELGAGNMYVKVDETSRDELGLLERSFNNSVASLRANTQHLLEHQEEITLQAEQLQIVNEELLSKNQELDHQKEELMEKKVIVEQQKEEITAQAENLMQLYREISEINNNLEQLVRERTEELAYQNKRLAEYAFTNAHKLRGPLTRIMGLINIINIAPTIEEKLVYMDLLNEAGKQLDQIVHTIQKQIADKDETMV